MNKPSPISRQRQGGPVRFFRKATSLTRETAFDERGDRLTAEAYDSLPSSRQGKVVGQTRLVRLRFAAEVFLHGTRLKLGGPETPLLDCRSSWAGEGR